MADAAAAKRVRGTLRRAALLQPHLHHHHHHRHLLLLLLLRVLILHRHCPRQPRGLGIRNNRLYVRPRAILSR